MLTDSPHTPVATRSPFASLTPAPAAPAAVRTPAPASPAGVAELGAVARALESLRDELRALRDGQDRIVELLRHSPAASLAGRAPDAAALDDDEPSLSAIRAQNRKSVLLIDDDPRTREQAIAELQQADVPVRAFDDGNAALSAIALDKPDVIVLELGLGGDMAGKDVINMIKATMEWVDVPIVLWTREPVANQKEARQIHGADEIVPKSSGAAALVARVINVFRRG
jgi:CheY-like chemotaxis protein